MIAVSPGDVLAIRTKGLLGDLVRIGELLGRVGHDASHVAVAHHLDSSGVFWGIEGRPGGVGWVDLRPYFRDDRVVCNSAQAKSPHQRGQVVRAVEQMLGTEYDWVGIAADACRDLGLPELFARDWHGAGTPGHVVCSSLACYVYDRVGLARPDPDRGGRFVQPGDWGRFIRRRGWQR